MKNRYDIGKVKDALDAREIARYFNMEEKRGNGNKAEATFFCCFHDDGKTPALHINSELFHCKVCGASGNALHLFAHHHDLDIKHDFAQVLEFAAQHAGVEPEHYIPPHLRTPHTRPKSPGRKTPPPHQSTPPTSPPRPARDLLAELWRILEPCPLTSEARAWLESRGIDPQSAHREGCRDIEAAHDDVLALLDGATQEELQAASLVNDEGKPWWPLRALEMGWPVRTQRDGTQVHDRGVMIPIWRPGEAHPHRWRWRYFDKRHDPKIQFQPGPRAGEWLGGHRAAEASTLIICEGEPDYLSLVEVLEDMPGVATIEDNGVTRWEELARSDKRVILAVHIDRDKEGMRPELAAHKVYGKLAAGIAGAALDHGRKVLEVAKRWHVIDVNGKEADLNDLHQAGELATQVTSWLDPVELRLRDTCLDAKWCALLEESYRAVRRAALEQVEEAHKKEASKGFINPMGEATYITQEQVPEHIARELDRAIKERSQVAIAINPGTGKTYVTMAHMGRALYNGHFDTLSTFSPSKVTRDAIQEDLERGLEGVSDTLRGRTLREQMKPSKSRSEDNCDEWHVYLEASRVTPSGGTLMCDRCERNPKNVDGDKKFICDFWRERLERESVIEIATHEVLALKHGVQRDGPKPRNPVHIEWGAMARAARQGGRFVPRFRGGVEVDHLELKPDASGEVLAALDHIVIDEGMETERYSPTKEGRKALLEFIAAHYDVPAHIDAIKGHLDTLEPERPVRAIVIDELTLSSCRQTVSATLEDLDWLRRLGLLPGDGPWTALCDQLARSRQFDDNGRPVIIGAPDIAPLFEGFDPRDIDLAELQRDELLSVLDEVEQYKASERLARLEACHDWRLAHAILRAHELDFSECHIQEGKLHLPFVRPLDLQEFDIVIVLDATMTPGIARGLYGPEMRYVRFEVERPDDYIDIARIEYDAGKSILKPDRPGQGRQATACPNADYRSSRALIIHQAIHRYFDSSASLHITHKRMHDEQFEQDEDSSAQMFAALHGHVIHFGGAESTGWNEAKSCDKVIVDAYFANWQGIKSQAATLCALAGEDWYDPTTRRRWLDEARFQLEGAPIIQIIERVRSWQACPDRRILIILLSERDLAPLGYGTRDVIDPDAWIFHCTGVARTQGGLGEATRAAVLDGQGVYLPAMARKSDGAPTSIELWANWRLPAKNLGVPNYPVLLHKEKWPIDRLFEVQNGWLQRRLEHEISLTRINTRVAELSRTSAYIYTAEVRDNSARPDFMRVSCGWIDDYDSSRLPPFIDQLQTHLDNTPGLTFEQWGKNLCLGHGKARARGRGASMGFLYFKSIERDELVARFILEPEITHIEIDGEVIDVRQRERPAAAMLGDLLDGLDLWPGFPTMAPMTSKHVRRALHELATQHSSPLASRRDLREAIKEAGGIEGVRELWATRHGRQWSQMLTEHERATTPQPPTPEQVLYRPSRVDQEATHLLRIHEDFESRRHECTQQMYEVDEPTSQGSCWPPEYYLELEQQLTREVYARHEASYRALVPHGPAGVLSFWPSYEQWCERLRSDKDPISWPPDDVWQTWCQRDPILARSLETFRQEVEALFGQYWYDTLHVHREVQPYADDMEQEDEMSSHFWHEAQESFEAWAAHLRTQLDGRGASLPTVFLEALYVEQRGEERIDLKRAWIPRRLELEFPFTVAFIKWARSTDVIFADEIQTREDFTRHLRLHLTWRTNQGREHHTVVAPTALFAAPCPFTEHDYYEEMGAWMWEVEHAERHLASFDDVDIDSMRLEWSLVDAHGIKLHTLTRSLRADAEEMRSLLAARDSSALYPEPDPNLWPF